MYTTPLTDFFISRHTTSSYQYRKKKNLAKFFTIICPSVHGNDHHTIHHREAKDTQVKSTLKSRLSTNQTLSNRLVGAVWCFVSSSLIEGDPSVFDGRGNPVHSEWVQTTGWTWWYIVPGPPSRRSLLTGVLPVKTGLKPAQTDQTPAVPPKSPQSSESEREKDTFSIRRGLTPEMNLDANQTWIGVKAFEKITFWLRQSDTGFSAHSPLLLCH